MIYPFISFLYLLPLLGLLISSKYSSLITISAFALASATSLIHWMLSGFNLVVYEKIWFEAGDQIFTIQLISDQISVMLMNFSAIIALAVSIYSRSYFIGKDEQARFSIILCFFMFFMNNLILSGNLLLSFFCWELIGLCSYLLIGFYRSAEKSGSAATKALLYNKIGDIGFIIALMGIWYSAGTFNILQLKITGLNNNPDLQLLISLGLLAAVAAKSAQFPLHNWLPDAMAGPSPASALIHSATMVTAGIFLISRAGFLFPPQILFAAGVIGMVTAFLGGWNALFQKKIKQVLAWSTVSQLGLMLMAASWGNSSAALVHLISHGFFKAGLFMIAGYLLKSIAVNTENELEAIAKSESKDKLIAVALLLFGLSLAGFPLTGSFLSKEAIASSLSSNYRFLFYLINGLTVIYTFRLYWILSPYFKVTKLNPISGFSFPILLLGLFTGWWIWSLNPFHSTDHFGITDSASFSITLIAISLLIISNIIAFLLMRMQLISKKDKSVYTDKVYQKAVITPFLKINVLITHIDLLIIDKTLHFIGYFQISFAHLAAAVDRYLVDGVVEMFAKSIGSTGTLIRKISKGNIQTYLWWALSAILILVIWQS